MASNIGTKESDTTVYIHIFTAVWPVSALLTMQLRENCKTVYAFESRVMNTLL